MSRPLFGILWEFRCWVLHIRQLAEMWFTLLVFMFCLLPQSILRNPSGFAGIFAMVGRRVKVSTAMTPGHPHTFAGEDATSNKGHRY